MNWIRLMMVVGIALVAGCEQKRASEEVDPGIIQSSTYTNKYFGFSITLPPTWTVQDPAAQKELVESRAKVARGNDPNTAADLKASEPRTVNLFGVFKQPQGTSLASSPNLMCWAIRVRDLSGVYRGKDYLFHVRKRLEARSSNFVFPSEVSSERFGGQDFDVLCADLPMINVTLHQKLHTIVMKGYALTFFTTFKSPEEETAVDDILYSLTFK